MPDICNMDRLFGKIRIPKTWESVNSFMFDYDTPRVVTMRSRRIGLTYRLVQLILFLYLVGYVFWASHGYQQFDVPESSVVTKVKGILRRRLPNNQTEIWDGNDFVVPAQETDAFFITTNLLYTNNQYQGTCPEDFNVGNEGIHCKYDRDCRPAGSPTPYGNGIRTGRCVNASGNGTCEIHAWCPTEVDVTPKVPVLFGHETVTILIKNHIFFRKFGVKRRNILETFTQEYLQTCRYDKDAAPFCPVFALRDIVKMAKEDFDVMAVKGGIIGINIDWNCNLDFNEDHCVPTYDFKRLDNKDDKIAKGWNFRHAFYHYDAVGRGRRDIVKFWGIRFVFLVGGRAGQFYPVFFILHIGSGIGLFGIASIICEFVISIGHKSDLLTSSKSVNLENLKARRRASIPALRSNGVLGPTPYTYENPVWRSDGSGFTPKVFRDRSQSHSPQRNTVVRPMVRPFPLNQEFQHTYTVNQNGSTKKPQRKDSVEFV